MQRRTGQAGLGCTIKGQVVPEERLGLLREVAGAGGAGAGPAQLRALMRQDGYVVVRGVLPRADVLAAREEVLQSLASVGEVDDAQRAE